MKAMQFNFEDFVVDVPARELRQDGRPIGMEPKVFDFLTYLISTSEKVSTRDEIIAHVWDGRIVSDTTISTCVKAARKVLNDDGQAQRLIKTVHGRGFRFVGTFHQTPRAVSPSEFKPSVLVMPMMVTDHDPSRQAIADNLVLDLSTVLTRIPLLDVLSQTVSFGLRHQPMSPMELHQQYGLTYLITGSLRQTSSGLRATLELSEAVSGMDCWSGTFEVSRESDPADDLMRAVLPRLETALVTQMVTDLNGRDGENSTRAQLIKAIGLLSLKGWRRETFAEAEAILRSIIRLDPNQAMAHAYLSLILGLGWRVGVLDGTSEQIADTIKAAETALDLDGGNSNVLGLAGCALSDVGQAKRAEPLLSRAVEIDPNNAQAWAALGGARSILGSTEDGVKAIKRGIELSPMDARLAVWWGFAALMSLTLGRLEDAREQALQGCKFDDGNHIPRVALAAIERSAGNDDAARAAMEEVRRLRPDITEREIGKLVGRRMAENLIPIL